LRRSGLWGHQSYESHLVPEYSYSVWSRFPIFRTMSLYSALYILFCRCKTKPLRRRLYPNGRLFATHQPCRSTCPHFLLFRHHLSFLKPIEAYTKVFLVPLTRAVCRITSPMICRSMKTMYIHHHVKKLYYKKQRETLFITSPS
jgi:hypothetical protein